METSSLKSKLAPWRELVVLFDSLLSWEKDWYPILLWGIITSKTVLLWYWEPSIISLIAIQGMIITILDFVGLRILSQVFKKDSWTDEKEKKLDRLCQDMNTLSTGLSSAHLKYQDFKDNKPVVHFGSVIMLFLVLAWMGSTFNGLFLLYLTVLTIFMLPGAHRRGFLKKYFAQITLKLAELFKGKDHMKKSE